MMKTSIRLLVLCSVVGMMSSVASAQQKTGKKPGAARPICEVQSVPKGMVIVGHKASSTCQKGFEFVVKRPGAADRVCADSPIPEGYTVDDTAGSTGCGGDNPLTNAYLISSGKDLYGIRLGMTLMHVTEKLGWQYEVSRGTPGNPEKGTTWRYQGAFRSTILIYFDNEDKVIGFEERSARN